MLLIVLISQFHQHLSYAAFAPPAIPADFPAPVSAAGPNAPDACTSTADPGSLTFTTLDVASDLPMSFSPSNLIILTHMQLFYTEGSEAPLAF